MFSERVSRIRRSLAFHLTFLFAAMFVVLSLVTFLISYEMTVSSIRSRTDILLRERMNEFSSLFSSKGINALREEMVVESRSAGIEKVFYRLLTSDGKEILSSDLGPWRGMGVSGDALKGLDREKGPVFETMTIPGRNEKVRVLYDTAGQGLVLQMGQSLKGDKDLYEDLRRVFGGVVVVILVLGILGGWLMARRSLSGVERVTGTAIAIAGGAMESRVPLSGRGDEIDRLSGVFNHMLERIQSLITEMKEVTDNIAHDLKSPITRIRGLTEVTLTGAASLDEYQAMAVNTIEECDRLLKIINVMLEISETEAGVAALRLSEVDISALVDDAGDLFQPLAEERGLHLDLNVPPQCLLHCDKNRLQQVVANLLDNAIKYTESGKITVSVMENVKEVIISVADTGIGILSDDIPHVFDRFFRSDKSRSVPGAGLGLSLVRAIVQKHGGEITVRSAPGAGSTFTLILSKIIRSR